MSKIISVDFESFYGDDCSIKTMGSRAYLEDPRTSPYLISVCDGTQTWAGHPKDFNWDALNGATLLSHNRAFDELAYQVNHRKGVFPKVDYAAWHCTASLSTYLCMRRDLLRASEFLLGEVVDKSYRLDAENKTWEQMVAAGVAEKVKQSGRVDAARCFQLWAKYSHLWPQMERDVSDLTIRQCRRGAQIDEALLDNYRLVAQTMLLQAESVLPWMKDGKKPTSTKAIAEECRKVGIPCPPVKKWDGEEAYDLWAATYGTKHLWVKAFTDYRVVNKFLTTLETIKSRLFDGGIFNYDLLYFGAHTGRWSGSGGFNMQNMRKQPLLCDLNGWLVTDMARLAEYEGSKTRPVWVKHVLDVRALFKARPGRKLIPSDLSQIEPRVLAWLVGDKAMLNSMASGQSPYEAHARATMNWTGGSLKAEAKDLYALAKARVLGLGYGCGWDKFITVAQNMAGLDITKDDPDTEFVYTREGEQCFDAAGEAKTQSGYGSNSRRIVKEYRESNPLVVGLWKKLDDAFKDSVGGDFEMTLPSGRKLRYPKVQRELKAVADPDNPSKFKRKWVTTALAFNQKRNAVVRQPFYGGLLTENLVQATARDVFAEHCLALGRTSGIDVLWTVHDEAVNECDQGITKRDVEQIMSYCPPWIEGLPLAAEAQEVPHYMK